MTVNLTKVASVASAPELLKAQIDLELGRVLIDATQGAKSTSIEVGNRTCQSSSPDQGKNFHLLPEIWSAGSEGALLELTTNNVQWRADTQYENGADVFSYGDFNDDAPNDLPQSAAATTLSENRTSTNGMTLPHGFTVSYLLSPAYHQQVSIEPGSAKGSAETERKHLGISDESSSPTFRNWGQSEIDFCVHRIIVAGCVYFIFRPLSRGRLDDDEALPITAGTHGHDG